jgi:hypothetical protein
VRGFYRATLSLRRVRIVALLRAVAPRVAARRSLEHENPLLERLSDITATGIRMKWPTAL